MSHDPDLLTDYFIEGHRKMEEIIETVTNTLISEHGFTVDEATESIAKSQQESPEMWNENANSADLAKYLASEDSDD